jgi:hypothetical protein
MVAKVRALKFWTEYRENADGSLREVDWVRFGNVENLKLSQIEDAISRVSKMTDGTWECIEPAYKAWKAGQEMPVSGTPLAAWSGATPQVAEILKQHMIRTVEDVRDLSEGQMAAIRLPGIRQLRDAAKAWDAARDNRKFEAELQRRDDEIEALKAQMETLVMMMSEAKDNTEEPVKRKPGRPRKDEGEAEAA